MNGMEIAGVIIVGLVLIVVALLLVNFYQGRQSNKSAAEMYPPEVRELLGAALALAAFFAVRTENKIDDYAVNNLLTPIMKLLGVEMVPIAPPMNPTPPAQPPAETPPANG